MTIILEYNLKIQNPQAAFKKLSAGNPGYKTLNSLLEETYGWRIHKKRIEPHCVDIEEVDLSVLENIAEFMAPRSFVCIIDEEADYHMYEMYFNGKTIEYLFPEWPFERRSKWENLNLQRLLKR